MPTENSLPFEEPELYAETDDGWTRIGKISEIPETTLITDDMIEPVDGDMFIPLKNCQHDVISTEFTFKPIIGKLSRKSIRWFRENIGLDLLHMRFPKKKNRRKKRLWRNAKKVFRLFFKA